MNLPKTSNTVEPTGEQTPARHTMFTWQGAGCGRLELVRVLWSTENRLRCAGRVVVAATAEDEGYSASFELSVDERGAVRRVLINSTCADYERQISLSRSGEGIWLVDDGSGVQRGGFEGALDVDIEGVVLANALPIRRLGLHREAAEHVLPVVYVSLPECSARLVQQTYRTLRPIDGSADAVIRYECESFAADLTVDADGMVLDYPGLAVRA